MKTKITAVVITYQINHDDRLIKFKANKNITYDIRRLDKVLLTLQPSLDAVEGQKNSTTRYRYSRIYPYRVFRIRHFDTTN